ncbi:MAG: 16S rRNA (guanine(527)-N(7))-methyltransferase RsmG [Hydrogenibacillus sp.]|nr:16S rRNA (guanine(527)-N(7))-methyltransferase RsmG [Hydrogenibacillus sp.]
MDELVEALARRGLRMDDRAAARFRRYRSLLLEWNAKMNLTAITDPREIAIKHFYDSLTVALSPHFTPPERMIDIGSGAGFPSLPIKIVYPEIEVVLVDALKKRLRFLQAVVEALGLTGVTLVHARAEMLGHAALHRERYPLVVARAVAALPVLVELTVPFCRLGGRVAALKGDKGRSELAAAEAAIERLGARPSAVESLSLPGGYGARTIIWLDKVQSTPKRYPRRPGEPARRPLA